MPDCNYCDKSFDSDKAYHRHLKKAHDPEELSRVDRRRVEGVKTESNRNVGAIILGAVIVGGLLLAIYVAYVAGSFGGADEPYGDTHEHGLFYMEINGDPIDFHQPGFVEQDPHFHFHDNTAYEHPEEERFVWHTHSHGVTLQYALESLGFEVADDGSTITIDGTTYDDGDAGTSVSITVNGEPVEPADYELEGVTDAQPFQGQGDDIAVIISTD